MSREQEYVSALRAALGIWQQMRSGELSYDDAVLARKLVNMPSGFELHIGVSLELLFLFGLERNFARSWQEGWKRRCSSPCSPAEGCARLRGEMKKNLFPNPRPLSQADAEQQAEFLPDALSLRIVGTYAQTELGHGTFVRGLETTATFDGGADGFVLHSPTLSATKWWPGGLGATATHAVVMARLFCGAGVDRGPHAFVVQLRDMETHEALPGVRVGDIGPKLGFGSVDNGWLELDHVCIRE